MTGLRWIGGLVRRRTAELAGVAVSIAMAVAFVVSLGAFVTQSHASLTGPGHRADPGRLAGASHPAR